MNLLVSCYRCGLAKTRNVVHDPVATAPGTDSVTRFAGFFNFLVLSRTQRRAGAIIDRPLRGRVKSHIYPA